MKRLSDIGSAATGGPRWLKRKKSKKGKKDKKAKKAVAAKKKSAKKSSKEDREEIGERRRKKTAKKAVKKSAKEAAKKDCQESGVKKVAKQGPKPKREEGGGEDLPQSRRWPHRSGARCRAATSGRPEAAKPPAARPKPRDAGPDPAPADPSGLLRTPLSKLLLRPRTKTPSKRLPRPQAEKAAALSAAAFSFWPATHVGADHIRSDLSCARHVTHRPRAGSRRWFHLPVADRIPRKMLWNATPIDNLSRKLPNAQKVGTCLLFSFTLQCRAPELRHEEFGSISPPLGARERGLKKMGNVMKKVIMLAAALAWCRARLMRRIWPRRP